MDQANYPNLDRPLAYQPYPQENFNNYPPPLPSNNFYPVQVNNNYPHQHDLQQPLIHNNHSDKKHEHKHKKKVKRVVSALVGFVCLAIELGVLYYVKKSTYIFEYCYWKFGINHYKSDVDQTLVHGNGRGSNNNFYFDIGCNSETDSFPECSSLCSLGVSLMMRMKSIYYALGFSEFLMLVLVICLISASFSKKPKMKKPLVSCLTLLSFTIFLCSCLYIGHKLQVLDLHEPDETKVTLTSDMDEPTEAEVADGGKILIGLVSFMLVYRVFLIFLAKS